MLHRHPFHLPVNCICRKNSPEVELFGQRVYVFMTWTFLALQQGRPPVSSVREPLLTSRHLHMGPNVWHTLACASCLKGGYGHCLLGLVAIYNLHPSLSFLSPQITN